MDSKIYIYGKHPVFEALTHAPQVVERVFIDTETHPDLDQLAKKRNIFRMPFDEKLIEKKIGEGAVHQKVAALVDVEKLMVDFHTFLESINGKTGIALTLLAEIQDPQKVGSIIRSATAFGLGGVLIPKDRQAHITGAVIKASVGCAFRIPLVAIGNVNQAIAELKEKRFWVYGLAGEGEKNIRDEDFSENTVLVIGNEGHGIREKTFEHCDITLRIPISKEAESLNAGTSAAVAFYEWRSKQK